MNSTDTSLGRWQVTSAADTLLGSFYFLVHSSSAPGVSKSVKVSTSKGSGRRHYAWTALSRQSEEVPPEVQQEIDRAIIRYLTGK